MSTSSVAREVAVAEGAVAHVGIENIGHVQWALSVLVERCDEDVSRRVVTPSSRSSGIYTFSELCICIRRIYVDPNGCKSFGCYLLVAVYSGAFRRRHAIRGEWTESGVAARFASALTDARGFAGRATSALYSAEYADSGVCKRIYCAVQ